MPFRPFGCVLVGCNGRSKRTLVHMCQVLGGAMVLLLHPMH